MSTPHGLGEAPRRDPRQPADLDPSGRQDIEQYLDESLDDGVPSDTKARRLAVDTALEQIAEIIPARHAPEVREALSKAYDLGCQHPDPMRSKQQSEHVCEPEVITVHVPGIPCESEDGQDGACDWTATPVKTRDPHSKTPAYALPERFWDVAYKVVAPQVEPPTGAWVVLRGLAQHNVSGGVASRDWFARRRLGEMVQAHAGSPSFPVYEVQGDPNALAVGRFKANARKMVGNLLGVDL